MYEELLESTEFYKKRYHNFSILLIFPLFILLIFVMLFLAFFTKEITLRNVATIEPVKVLSQIQSISNNKIILNSLKENAIVSAGDVLVEYEAIHETLQGDRAQIQLDLLEKQKKELVFLKRSFETTTNQFPEEDTFGYYRKFEEYLNQRQTLSSSIEQQNGTIASQNAAAASAQNAIAGSINDLNDKISDYETIKHAITSGTTVDRHNQGYAIYATYVAQTQGTINNVEKGSLKNQILAQVDSQIQQLKSELSNHQVQYSSSGVQQSYNSSLDSQLSALQSQKLSEVSQELTVVEQKIDELTKELEVANVGLAKTKIISKVSGIVHVNKEVSNAELIPSGTVIAQIYPPISEVKKVKIETYIPSKDISSLKVGQNVFFKAQNSSNKEFSLTSKITSIDSNATKTETGSYFKVVSEVSVSRQQIEFLKYGMTGDFIVTTGKKSYLDYYLDKFFN